MVGRRRHWTRPAAAGGQLAGERWRGRAGGRQGAGCTGLRWAAPEHWLAAAPGSADAAVEPGSAGMGREGAGRRRQRPGTCCAPSRPPVRPLGLLAAHLRSPGGWQRLGGGAERCKEGGGRDRGRRARGAQCAVLGRPRAPHGTRRARQGAGRVSEPCGERRAGGRARGGLSRGWLLRRSPARQLETRLALRAAQNGGLRPCSLRAQPGRQRMALPRASSASCAAPSELTLHTRAHSSSGRAPERARLHSAPPSLLRRPCQVRGHLQTRVGVLGGQGAP